MQLADLLDQGRPLLADGATGTNLFAAGLMAGDSPELWNETHSGEIEALHRSFVEAGADIILTNSFGGNTRRLMLHALEGRCRAINATAARLARGVADRAARPVVVGGSVGPTGDLMAPLGPLTEDEATAIFVVQIEGLAEGGADVAWIETMSSADEMRAAARAAVTVGLPYTLTASFDTAGRTMMGLGPDAFAAFADTLPGAPLAIGANCGVGASDLLASILAIRASRPAMRVIAKANAGIPEWHGSHIHYSGTPALMADYARMAIDAGAAIIGGCCGTTPAHLAAMRQAIDTHEPRGAPSVEDIVERIGPLVSPPAKADAAPARRSRREGPSI